MESKRCHSIPIPNQKPYSYPPSTLTITNSPTTTTIYLSGGFFSPKTTLPLHKLTITKSDQTSPTDATVSHTWRKLADMPGQSRKSHGFVASPVTGGGGGGGGCDYLYVVGGYTNNQRVTAECYRYDVGGDSWCRIEDLPLAVNGNGLFCHYRDGEEDKYCIGSVGNRGCQGEQFFVYNVSMRSLAFPVGEWSSLRVGGWFTSYGQGVQLIQLSSEDAIVVVGDQRVYSLKMNPEFNLTKLKSLDQEPFVEMCGFGRWKNTIGIGGDKGQYCEITFELP
eukprot:CAMPEP_0115039444 /NCGR_PEP_ID=MMETSP0216-20121206/44029_1 /TAXON_ID=223996 /ORGANISM="Protocruzia adherens, Strain Boccale" /LENGTH=278 /DNA_ID=CAMNT_0002420079 /DNA_START=398 /DNA_END=1234 /DNA_ORIENTATION=-